LLYADAGEFVAAVAPFVHEGIQGGERVLVTLAPDKLAWVREELGEEAAAVELLDAPDTYDRNGPMLSSLLERLSVPGDRRTRVVAEQALATRTPDQRRAYMRYEAAANVAYRPFAASVLCPYDTAQLPDAVLRDALRTHPEVLGAHAASRREPFLDPREFVRRNSRVEAPPPDAIELALEGLDDIAPIRQRIGHLAGAAGLERQEIDGLTVAVSELASNAIIHGNPPRRVWAYVKDGAFVCHVHDGGRGPDDPLVGYLVPEPTGRGGRGLWLAHQLCDIVEVATDRAGAHLTVRTVL
jgi:anti-sigma regulatory factor (Ser/Thr protein kinase)